MLGATRKLSDQIRWRLGDPALNAGSAASLEKATTSSLAALRAFSAGIKAVNERRWEAAASLMEEAVQEDPQFALAHIYAAHSYSNVLNEDRAAPHYQAALASLSTSVVRF